MRREPKQCPAMSPDGTRCDRPEGHYGDQHDGPITVDRNGHLNRWRWSVRP